MFISLFSSFVFFPWQTVVFCLLVVFVRSLVCWHVVPAVLVSLPVFSWTNLVAPSSCSSVSLWIPAKPLRSLFWWWYVERHSCAVHAPCCPPLTPWRGQFEPAAPVPVLVGLLWHPKIVWKAEQTPDLSCPRCLACHPLEPKIEIVKLLITSIMWSRREFALTEGFHSLCLHSFFLSVIAHIVVSSLTSWLMSHNLTPASAGDKSVCWRISDGDLFSSQKSNEKSLLNSTYRKLSLWIRLLGK